MVERAALELAVTGEARLMLAVEPPAGTKQQPLTLDALQVCAAQRRAAQRPAAWERSRFTLWLAQQPGACSTHLAM